MAVNRYLYSSHYVQIVLPATTGIGGAYSTTYLYLPTQSASCDETIPLDDVLVLGKLGAAGRLQKDVTGCKSSVKFYVAQGYTHNDVGLTSPTWDSGIKHMTALKGQHLEHMREAALGGLNSRVSLLAPDMVQQFDDDPGNGTCSNATFVDNESGCLSDPAQCSNSTSTSSAACLQAAGTCSDTGFNNNYSGCIGAGETWTSTNTWTANTWTAVGTIGIDAADPYYSERTDFLMYGIINNFSLNVAKGGFIEGDLSFEGIGRPLMMDTDTYTQGSNYGGNAYQTNPNALMTEDARNSQDALAATAKCIPVRPEMYHVMFGHRQPNDDGWEDTNRRTHDVTKYAENTHYLYKINTGGYCYTDATHTQPLPQHETSGACTGAGGTWLARADQTDIASQMTDGWVANSFKFSFDMPTESLSAMGKVGSSGVGAHQWKLAGAADPEQGDTTSSNVGENGDFYARHRIFAKPPFKSSITVDGISLDVFPAGAMETNAGSYLNTFYLGNVIIRMPHNGSVAKGTSLNNTATTTTARSVNQSAGEVGATYSITMEATDAVFTDRASWSHSTNSTYGTCAENTAFNNDEAGCCTDGGGTWASSTCTGGSHTWTATGTGNVREDFDPFKIFTKATAGR